MPTGIFDIRDKAEVFHIAEIEAGEQQCRAKGVDYIEVMNLDGSGQRVIPLAKQIEILKGRWQRACLTGQLMDAIRAGYCTISPASAPPMSGARH